MYVVYWAVICSETCLVFVWKSSSLVVISVVQFWQTVSTCERLVIWVYSYLIIVCLFFYINVVSLLISLYPSLIEAGDEKSLETGDQNVLSYFYIFIIMSSGPGALL